MSQRSVVRISLDDSMIDLIKADYNILPLLSRFSLPLGFGDRSIRQFCDDNGVDACLFLLIVNYALSGNIDRTLLNESSAVALVDFLHNSHDYFLAYKFPHIKDNLLGALDSSHDDINPAIVRFFDNYVNLVREHFLYEEANLFPYIRDLVGETDTNYRIATFVHCHDSINEPLSDLKNLILRYYTTSMPNRMYDVLVDIFSCEEDLDNHADIENFILVPLIR